jgi:hypothetical protein
MNGKTGSARQMLILSAESIKNNLEIPETVRHYMEFEYLAIEFFLWRPFLQEVLNNLTTHQVHDIDDIPSAITTRARNAIDCSIKLIATVRTWSVVNWFSLRQSFMAAILVLAASRTIDGAVLEKEVMDTLDGATEIFARTAKTSEAARRALRLVSKIRASM